MKNSPTPAPVGVQNWNAIAWCIIPHVYPADDVLPDTEIYNYLLDGTIKRRLISTTVWWLDENLQTHTLEIPADGEMPRLELVEVPGIKVLKITGVNQYKLEITNPKQNENFTHTR